MRIHLAFNSHSALNPEFFPPIARFPQKTTMKVDELKQILTFIGGGHEIFITGGEPTEAVSFQSLSQEIEAYSGIRVLMSNGLFLKEFIPTIKRAYTAIILTINPPFAYTELQWESLMTNLALCAEQNIPMHLQIPVRKIHETYLYVETLLRSFPFQSPIALTIMPPASSHDSNRLDYFTAIKMDVLMLINMIRNSGRIAYFTEPFPGCIYTAEETFHILENSEGFYYKELAVRFVMLPEEKIGHYPHSLAHIYPLAQFESISALEACIYQNELPFRFKTPAFSECTHCLMRIQEVCQGGDLQYKQQKTRSV